MPEFTVDAPFPTTTDLGHRLRKISFGLEKEGFSDYARRIEYLANLIEYEFFETTTNIEGPTPICGECYGTGEELVPEFDGVKICPSCHNAYDVPIESDNEGCEESTTPVKPSDEIRAKIVTLASEVGYQHGEDVSLQRAQAVAALTIAYVQLLEYGQ